MCEHGMEWCPFGCHDEIDYLPDNAGMELLHELIEDWANDGTLDAFHLSPDPRTGEDGLDELVTSNLLIMPYDPTEGAD